MAEVAAEGQGAGEACPGEGVVVGGLGVGGGKGVWGLGALLRCWLGAWVGC